MILLADKAREEVIQKLLKKIYNNEVSEELLNKCLKALDECEGTECSIYFDLCGLGDGSFCNVRDYLLLSRFRLHLVINKKGDDILYICFENSFDVTNAS